MIKLLNSFRKDESGATMVEYGLLVAVIAMVVILSGVTLGTNIDGVFSDAATCAGDPTTTNCP
ncbi:MAG: Flp family type IVb pilin [Sneathiella sp.]|uniref:Flp family type IVb pilin n=1 Tax=Sneathiella sp. TaxID=1964365 RepID=UPI0030028D67